MGFLGRFLELLVEGGSCLTWGSSILLAFHAAEHCFLSSKQGYQPQGLVVSLFRLFSFIFYDCLPRGRTKHKRVETPTAIIKMPQKLIYLLSYGGIFLIHSGDSGISFKFVKSPTPQGKKIK